MKKSKKLKLSFDKMLIYELNYSSRLFVFGGEGDDTSKDDANLTTTIRTQQGMQPVTKPKTGIENPTDQTTTGNNITNND